MPSLPGTTMTTVLMCPPWVAFSIRSAEWSPERRTDVDVVELRPVRSRGAGPCASDHDHDCSGITTPSMITCGSFGHCGAAVTGSHGRPQREIAAVVARLPAVFWSSSTRSAGVASLLLGRSFSCTAFSAGSRSRSCSSSSSRSSRRLRLRWTPISRSREACRRRLRGGVARSEEHDDIDGGGSRAWHEPTVHLDAGSLGELQSGLWSSPRPPSTTTASWGATCRSSRPRSPTPPGCAPGCACSTSAAGRAG